MRALVIGASGQVGAALSQRLDARGHSVVGTHARVAQHGTVALDLTDTAATARLIAEVAPDWVFCPAAFSHVDGCEERPEEAFRINRDAPGAAARAAAKHAAGFVFFSSDYVFDGTAGPYAEDDPAHPLSVYGQSKLEGERLARRENPRAIVIRTTVVYGPEPQGKNFVYQLLRRARAGEPMRIPVDQRSSPTYNVDLAAATVELAERDVPGIFHVAGPDVLSRFDFAWLACETWEIAPAMLEPVVTSALAQRAARPLRAGLRIDRVRELSATPLRGARDGLRAMRNAGVVG
jgi:dTDP-4-dehydrorhamnose reductase